MLASSAPPLDLAELEKWFKDFEHLEWECQVGRVLDTGEFSSGMVEEHKTVWMRLLERLCKVCEYDPTHWKQYPIERMLRYHYKDDVRRTFTRGKEEWMIKKLQTQSTWVCHSREYDLRTSLKSETVLTGSQDKYMIIAPQYIRCMERYSFLEILGDIGFEYSLTKVLSGKTKQECEKSICSYQVELEIKRNRPGATAQDVMVPLWNRCMALLGGWNGNTPLEKPVFTKI